MLLKNKIVAAATNQAGSCPGGATDSSPGQGCHRQPPPGVGCLHHFLTCERSEASKASIIPGISIHYWPLISYGLNIFAY